MTTMTETFAALYTRGAQAGLYGESAGGAARGGEATTCARGYAELGKPDFALAFLLLADMAEADKYEILAQAHERRPSWREKKR